MLIDIHGSCVSRSIFNHPDNKDVKVNHYFARNNIVSSMMPPANIITEREELKIHDSEYSHRCMREAIEKKAVPMLMESESDFLVIDFFDFCQPVACYKDTTFSTYDYCFYNTSAFRNDQTAYSSFNFFDAPICLWYGYIDLYFQKMSTKYGNGNIILNKLSCFNGYIDKNGNLKPTPENLLHFGNAKFNKNLDELENYVIQKHNPYVIDITKYFIPDEHHNPDVTPIHYEGSYQDAGWFHINNILMNKPVKKYHDNLPPRVVTSLFNRNINNDDFIKIYNSRANPYPCHDLLDDIFTIGDAGDIAENRHWLGKLYTEFTQQAPSVSDYQNQNILVNYLTYIENFKISNAYQKQIVSGLHEKKQYLSLPLNEMVRQFNTAIEASDPKWITILKCMGILYMEDSNINHMLLNYYTAANDTVSAARMRQRLGVTID